MRFKYDIKQAARMLRDKTNEPRGMSMKPLKRADKISLADAEAYILDVRDNVERIEGVKENGVVPTGLRPDDVGICWPRSHERDLYTNPNRGPAYCRMVEYEHLLGLSVPA